MRKDYLKIALVISLVFNAAVVAAFAYGLTRRSYSRARMPREFIHEPFSYHGHRFARRIGVPEERAARFACAMRDTSGEMQELRASLQRKRRELIDLLEKTEPDKASVIAKIDEIVRLQGDLEKAVISRLLDAKSVLTDRERARLMTMLRSKCLCADSVVSKPADRRHERKVP